MVETLIAVPHSDLVGQLRDGVRLLFESEYQERNRRPWDPDLPYGYAPHDIHVIAQNAEGQVIGHIGWGSRCIFVGERPHNIAGIGGVLVAPQARGQGLGKHLMKAATDTMQIMNAQGITPIDFGYLGCREEVVGFYQACGFTRVAAREFYVNTQGMPAVEEPGAPILVFPVAQQSFPAGDIDLMGRSW